MKTAVLVREHTGDEGTFGRIYAQGNHWYTAELPWRNNERDISCIPEGIYTATPYASARFGLCYQVGEVPDRSAILVHVGNWAGDVSKDYRSDVEGCILIGMARNIISGQYAVSSSREAIGDFHHVMEISGREPITLIIHNETELI